MREMEGIDLKIKVDDHELKKAIEDMDITYPKIVFNGDVSKVSIHITKIASPLTRKTKNNNRGPEGGGMSSSAEFFEKRGEARDEKQMEKNYPRPNGISWNPKRCI